VLDFGLEPNELIPGEKGVASVKCTITPMQYPHLSSEGTLIVTNYKVEKKKMFYKIFLGYI